MTTLSAYSPTDEQADLLALVADEHSPLGKPLADAFREACEAEAAEHGGWIDPNAVRARLMHHPAYEPRQYAALWSASSGRNGFLVKTDRLTPITGAGSRGNGNKAVPYRKLRGAA